MSRWKELEIGERVRDILAKVARDSKDHHLGTPFVTAYQLAIEFDRCHPELVKQLGLNVGGKGTGEHASLAQYLARELSQRLKRDAMENIEGAFLSRLHVASLRFSSEVESSTENLSMFRLK